MCQSFNPIDDYISLHAPVAHSLALVKKTGEVYVFTWTSENTAAILRTFGRFANNYNLSFTWYDAAVCAEQVREKMKSAETDCRNGHQ